MSKSKNKHKQIKDESFPVGKLVRESLRPLVKAYYMAARAADDIADDSALTAEEKLKRLEAQEAAFRRGKGEQETSAAAALGRLFQAENLDVSLYLDLLTAFRRDAENIQPQIWEQLIDYCKYSAAPVGRFMLAIHNENPSTYLPAEILCAVLQIVNHLQDLKADAVRLRRFYLPSELMQQAGAANSDIYLSETTAPLRAVINYVLCNLKAMLKDAAVLPSLVKDLRLRAEIGVILSLTNSVIQKIEKGDVLAQDIRPSRFDWVRAVLAGWTTALLGRKRIFRTAK